MTEKENKSYGKKHHWFSPIKDAQGKKTKEYECWYQMIRRCRSAGEKLRNPTYQNVSCCDEWLNYDTFYDWLIGQSNYLKWKEGQFDLDKDILVKGNKIYSPSTCTLVPKGINYLFIKSDARRGDLPIGVSYVKKHNKYLAHISCRNKGISIGLYNTPKEAFQAYKKYKEEYIKEMAEKYYTDQDITFECYQAMINYIVEITD